MLEWCSMRRDDDLVAGLQVLAAPGLGDEVDAFGGAADEDDLARLRRVEEALDLDAGLFVGRGGALAQHVDAAMDVGVVDFVEVSNGVEDREGLLRGGRVVEVDQRLAVDLLPQDRESPPRTVVHVEAAAERTLLSALMEFSRIGPCSSMVRFNAGHLDAVDDVVGEGVGQQAARLALPMPRDRR